MRAKEDMIEDKVLSLMLSKLQEAILEENYVKIRKMLIKIVPEFTPQSSIKDLLYEK